MAADGVGATEWLEMGGEKKPLVMSDLSCADGCGWQMGAENCADGCGQRGCNGVAGNGRGEGKGRERMGKEGKRKKPLVMSDLGCADGCGRQMGAENCADGCGRRGCKGVAGNGWGEEAAGDERPWLRTAADSKWVRRTARTAADGVGARGWLEMGGEKKPLVMSDVGCGRRGCKGVAGNGWGEEAAGDERPWLRGQLRTANGCGELRGRLRTAWVQGGGWKWVGRRSRW